LIKCFGTQAFSENSSRKLASEAGVSGPGTVAVEGVSKENARAEQTQYRRHYLNHRNLPSRPARDRTIAALHSQKDSGRRTEIETD
jgi:hypothetical protein